LNLAGDSISQTPRHQPAATANIRPSNQVTALTYDVIQVRLDEGVQLMSNIIGLGEKPLKIGMRVKACFDAVSPEITLIKFTPVGTE